MSRSGSRYPSAFGHTPSYRSYVKGDLVSQPIGYNVSLPGVSSYGLGSGRLGSASAFGANDLAPLNYGRSLVPGGDLSTSNSSAYSKQTQSSYSSYSDSSRDGGRPVVDYASESTLRSSTTGPSGIPHNSYSHSSSHYNSENPYGNRMSSYSYNI